MTTKLQDKVIAMQDWMQSQLFERESAVQSLMIAALAGENAVLIGPPGTAKSQLSRLFSRAITGATYFEQLLTRFSTPEDLLGPLSLAGLQADKYRRQLGGRFADSHVVFLDEVFKSNAGTLNALLAGLNERVVHDDGAVKRIPLRFCLGASNELPKGEEGLEALWDRFMVRITVGYVRDRQLRSRLALGGHALKNDPPPTMTVDEWDAACVEAMGLKMDDRVANALVELTMKLEKEGIAISDRRMVKLGSLLRSAAYVSGDSQCDTEHFLLLSNALWDRPEQQAVVTAKCSESQAPQYVDAQRKHDAVMSVIAPMIAANDGGQDVKALAQIGQAMKELKALGLQLPKDSKPRNRIRGLNAKLAEIHAQLTMRAAERHTSAEGATDF